MSSRPPPESRHFRRITPCDTKIPALRRDFFGRADSVHFACRVSTASIGRSELAFPASYDERQKGLTAMLARSTVSLASSSAGYLFAAMLINAKSNTPRQPPTQNATTTHHIDMIHLVAGV